MAENTPKKTLDELIKEMEAGVGKLSAGLDKVGGEFADTMKSVSSGLNGLTPQEAVIYIKAFEVSIERASMAFDKVMEKAFV